MKVSLKALPYVPKPQVDELLSSWIERIGLFYGIGYLGARVILEPSRTANERAANEDLDSSESIRQMAMQWSGLPENLIPELVPRQDETTLEVSARLAYCPACWTGDVRQGRSPYIRRNWTKWSCVACSEHKTWLYAREPLNGFGSELNGWASVWQSDASWAKSAHVRHEPELLSFALGLEGRAIANPDCSWEDLENDFERLVGQGWHSVLSVVTRPEHGGVRSVLWESIEVGGPSRRITDAHLHGYGRSQPGWIAGRISCLVAATEIFRILEDRPPAMNLVRRTLEEHAGGRRLIDECRAGQSQNNCHWQSQNSCHVSGTSKRPRRQQQSVRLTDVALRPQSPNGWRTRH
jgi:hypothetical protein